MFGLKITGQHRRDSPDMWRALSGLAALVLVASVATATLIGIARQTVPTRDVATVTGSTDGTAAPGEAWTCDFVAGGLAYGSWICVAPVEYVRLDTRYADPNWHCDKRALSPEWVCWHLSTTEDGRVQLPAMVGAART